MTARVRMWLGVEVGALDAAQLRDGPEAVAVQLRTTDAVMVFRTASGLKIYVPAEDLRPEIGLEIVAERDAARAERDNARADIVILKTERDAALQTIEALRADCDGLRAVCDEYRRKLREARAQDDAAVAHEALAERDVAVRRLAIAERAIGASVVDRLVAEETDE